MYLEVDEHFPTHPKTMKLCGRLQNAGAPCYILKLWCWACGNARDGNLSDLKPEDIEFIVGWTLDKGKFYLAAVDAGFIDEEMVDGEVVGRRIHNWMRRTGAAIVRMETEADRKKRLRAHRNKTCGGRTSCEFCQEDEKRQRTSGGHDAKEADPAAGRRTADPDQVKTSQGKASPVKASQDPDGAARAIPRPGATWSAVEWLRRYKGAWESHASYSGRFYGDTGDAQATGRLADELTRLPQTERLAAENRAPQMFDEFLGKQDPKTAGRRHPWIFFVQEFGSLRVPSPAIGARAGPRDVRVGSVPAPGPEHKYRKGAQTI